MRAIFVGGAFLVLAAAGTPVLCAPAAPPDETSLTRPGVLFDMGALKATSCNSLSVGRFSPQGLDASKFPPIPAFDDSASIGASAKYESLNVWAKTETVLAAAAAAGNGEAAKVAVDLLTSWAAAGAGLKTALDTRYLGAGKAEKYDPEAAAPVLDMQNAAILGGVAFTTAAMLGDYLTADQQSMVSKWAVELTKKYDLSGAARAGKAKGVFMSHYPSLVSAVVEGDAARYQQLVSGLYRLFRTNIDRKGAILKNANRGDRALAYQSMGILVVLSTMEIVETQGGKVPADIETRLHLAVKFLLDGDRDNRVVKPYATMGFNNPGRGDHMERNYADNADHYWWMIDYIARYPEIDNSKRLRVLLADRDTFEQVDRNILASTWVPYPINCFRRADLSSKAVEEARQFVSANYPKVEPAPVGGFALGKPKIKEAQPFKFSESGVVNVGSGRANKQFAVFAREFEVAGQKRPVVGFQVLVDFNGGLEPSDETLFRITLMRPRIGDAESAKPSYLSCGQVATQRLADDEQIRLHIGRNTETNSCILKKMSSADRTIWASVLVGLDQIIERAEGPQRDELRTLYRQMVY